MEGRCRHNNYRFARENLQCVNPDQLFKCLGCDTLLFLLHNRFDIGDF